MSALEQIALAWQCLMHSFRQLFRPALWGPWFLLGAVQALVVALLVWFAHPWVSWAVVPWLSRAAGDVLHYPQVFRVLPALFARADWTLGATLGAVVAGASTALFASVYDGREPRESAAWTTALKQTIPLVIVNLPLALIALGVSVGAEALLAPGSGVPRRLVWSASLGLTLLVQAWFLYATAFVVIERRGPIAALAELPRAARRGLVAAVFLTVVTLAPLLPLQRLTEASETIVLRGVPEIVGWLMLAQIAVALVSAFLLTGSATLVFQSALRHRSDSPW